jgi:hypothetical protein
MRYNRRRLVVVNKENNSERVMKSAINYVNKMHKKGWYPTLYSEGDSFFEYECYVHTVKPKNEKEKADAIQLTIERGWQFKNEICIGKEWGNGFYN